MLRLALGTVLLCPLILTTTCRPGLEKDGDESKEPGLFLSYRVGGGMDTYTDGDRYGYGMDIQFDGHYTVYRRLYQHRNSTEPSIREEPIDEGQLDQEALGALRSAVDSVSVSSIPKRLPDVDPRNVEVRGPAETVVVRVRSTPSDSLVEMQADMGADREHYPPAFLELHSHLEGLLRDRLEDRVR